MSAYLTSLAATLTQPDEGIRPRLPGRFESIHGRTALPSTGLDEPAESVTAPAMADSSDRHSSQRPPRSENQQSDAVRSARSPKSAEQTSAGREPVNRDAVERPLPVALLVPGEHAEVAASPSAPTSAVLRPGRLVPGVERGSKGPLPAGSPARPAHATFGLEDDPHPVPDEPMAQPQRTEPAQKSGAVPGQSGPPLTPATRRTSTPTVDEPILTPTAAEGGLSNTAYPTANDLLAPIEFAVREEGSASSPTIRVHIGRIEIRAVSSPQPPQRARSRRQPAVTLERYLARRNGGPS